MGKVDSINNNSSLDITIHSFLATYSRYCEKLTKQKKKLITVDMVSYGRIYSKIIINTLTFSRVCPVHDSEQR